MSAYDLSPETSGPMTHEAYQFWIEPFKGVALRRFLTFDNMKMVSSALQRPLTIQEVKLLVDFERDSQGEPIIAKCAVTGARFPVVRWVVPNKIFCTKLYDNLNVGQSVIESDLHVFGCFYLNQKEPLKDPIALSGAPCPGYVKSENRYEQSCLRDMMQKTGGRHLGIPLSAIKLKQDEAREAEKQVVVALDLARKEQEKREALRKERENKLNSLAADLGFVGTESDSPAPHCESSENYVEPIRQAKPQVGRGVKRLEHVS